MRWCEQRLRQIDAGLPETRPVTGRFHQAGASHTVNKEFTTFRREMEAA